MTKEEFATERAKLVVKSGLSWDSIKEFACELEALCKEYEHARILHEAEMLVDLGGDIGFGDLYKIIKGKEL